MDKGPSFPSSEPQADLGGGVAEVIGAEGFALTRTQARVAFVSSCTHGSVVASFPASSDKGTATAAAAEAPASAHDIGEGTKGGRTAGEEDTYWKVGLACLTKSLH